MARALGQKRSTDFFIEILKKALFFDTINLETAKMLLLLYLTYKELRLFLNVSLMVFNFQLFLFYLTYKELRRVECCCKGLCILVTLSILPYL